MKATELTPGKVVTFTPTGNSMTITLVTEKRISWTIEATRGVGNGKNIYRKMWSTLEQFQLGLNDGTYIINK